MILEDILKQKGYITPKDAETVGVTKYDFYKFVQENNLETSARGVYIAKDEWFDPLLLIHKRCPQAVFSHDEAFYYHKLSNREPIMPSLTIYTGYNPHRLTKDGGCKVYTVKRELLGVGKTAVKDFFGNEVPMYDLERTIVDLIRSRNNIEIQDFNDVIRAFVRRPDKDLHKLSNYARLFGVGSILSKYLRILL